MDKQLFYTNRLKAAWMDEEFNVKLRGSRGEKLYWDGGDFRVEKACGVFGGTHFYVDKDSLPIFRLKTGDVIQAGDDQIEKIYIRPEDRVLFRWGTDVNICPIVTEIIQRDNKAFFWPEVENG